MHPDGNLGRGEDALASVRAAGIPRTETAAKTLLIHNASRGDPAGPDPAAGRGRGLLFGFGGPCEAPATSAVFAEGEVGAGAFPWAEVKDRGEESGLPDATGITC